MDAYRPLAAQIELWKKTHDGAFVADPLAGNGSLHTWGVAVDATLVDEEGRDVAMPTTFDEFNSSAKRRYHGDRAWVGRTLMMRQRAVRDGGLCEMPTRWAPFRP